MKKSNDLVWSVKKNKLPLVFIEPGTKINAKYYKESVLENVLKSKAEIIYNGSPWIFQQDSEIATCPKFVSPEFT